MFRRAGLLLSLAGLYFVYKRWQQRQASTATDHIADAQWANEGGSNAPESV